MTDVTRTPRTVSFREEGYLLYGIAPADTSLIVAPVYKYITGVRTKSGLSSTAGFGVIIEGNKVERFSFGGSSVDADKNTTLSSIRRGLPQTGTVSNSTDLTAGTGLQFSRGAKVIISDDPWFFRMAAYQDLQNTFTDDQTFQGAVVVNSTTKTLQPPQMTTTQRDALVSPRGIIENTTTGTFQQYIGGSWNDIGNTGTLDASTTVAGKAEEATLAEVSAGTAAGGTGARLFINPSLVKKDSAGAAEGNIVALGANAKIATSLIGGILTPTVKSADYTAAAGDLVVCSPISTAYTVTLPASPSAGDLTGLVLDSGFNIAYDAVGHSSAPTSNSLTFSHTCTGSNRALFVAVWTNVNNTDKITGVTYNGVAMTRVSTATVSTTRAYLYALANPASGAHNIVISASDSLSDIYASSASYTGVNQTTPYNADATNTTAGATSLGVAVTTTIDQSWVLIMGGGAMTATSITNGTIRYANSPPIGDTNGAVTPAGAKTLTLNWTGSTAAEAISCAIVPMAAVTLNPNGKSINGSSSNRTFAVNGDCYILQYNGTQWNIVSYVHNAP